MDQTHLTPSRQDVADWLTRCGLASSPSDVTRIVSVGDGNMNFVYRVTVDGRTVIVKRSVPYVAKYPQIPAPVQRIATEIEFYRFVVDDSDLSESMPRLLGSDAEGHTMVLDAVEHGGDWRKLYDPEHSDLVENVFDHAANWLRHLHGIEPPESIQCAPLRQLNHSHWFGLPLSRPAVIELDAVSPGLDHATDSVRGDGAVRRGLDRIGKRYLDPMSCPTRRLLHGDYFPGAWLDIGTAGICVIDPEFAFVGPPEFDLGVLIAHHRFCGGQVANEDRWIQDHASTIRLDPEWVEAVAASEMMRRLLGVAQLPLVADTDRRVLWIEQAAECLRRFAD